MVSVKPTLTRKTPMSDKWSGLADLLANLIEKYATVLDIGNIPVIVAKNRIEDVRNKTKKE